MENFNRKTFTVRLLISLSKFNIYKNQKAYQKNDTLFGLIKGCYF